MATFACFSSLLAAAGEPSALDRLWFYVQIFIGFSFIIFVHELGHFIVAKWAGVRVEQFAIGFMREIIGFTYGETRYSFNLLPLGGYVKMLGQEDFEVDKTGDLQFKDDPRSFANKPVGHRMAIVSAGVIMNLILAGVLFMVVFLVGKEVAAPRLGLVLPDEPAAMAGLQPGDRILSINGDEIDEFNDISMSVVLAEPDKALDFEIEREGSIQHVSVPPRLNPKTGRLQIGISPAQTAEIVAISSDCDLRNSRHPRIGDKLVEVGGQEVTEENANDFVALLGTNPLKYPEVIVSRPEKWDGPEDGPRERVAVDIIPHLRLFRAERKVEPNLLGLVPPVQFSFVEPGGRAELAGIKVGDVILSWDGIDHPTSKQVEESILNLVKDNPQRPERDIPIRVMRGGVRKNLVVRPKVKRAPLTGKLKRPKIDADYNMIADLLVVASVVDEIMEKPSPAKLSGLPEGAFITAVNGVEVKTWIELCEQLRKAAGEQAVMTYDFDGQKGLTCEFPVPRSVRTELGLGPEAVIVEVDGNKQALVKGENRTAPVVVKHPLGLKAALKAAVGKTVEITYRENKLAETKTAQCRITEDMVYPWVSSVLYTVDLGFGSETTVLRKSSPIAALKVGVKKTYYFVMQVYQVMERMIFSRSFGVENISGPVGIVKMGSQMAEAGTVQLLFFLAIISANLAVINFLPLPIVDGGLMVFLLIEKIKGSPISLRVQVATQIIGLILIVSAFLYVTLQDLTR